MKRRLFVATAALAAVLLAGRTTMPERFTQAEGLPCGYVMGARDRDGFALEVVYLEHSFFERPDPAILAARDCFRKLTDRLTGGAAPVHVSESSAVPIRGITDMSYLVYVTGRVSLGYAATHWDSDATSQRKREGTAEAN